jgi:hypothetical protein
MMAARRSARLSKLKADSQRACAAFIATLVLLVFAAPARAEEPDSPSWRSVSLQTYDVLLMRPLGLASLIAGAGFFALGAPLVAPFGDLGAIQELYVEEPFEFTFRRPLGDFDS